MDARTAILCIRPGRRHKNCRQSRISYWPSWRNGYLIVCLFHARVIWSIRARGYIALSSSGGICGMCHFVSSPYLLCRRPEGPHYSSCLAVRPSVCPAPIILSVQTINGQADGRTICRHWAGRRSFLVRRYRGYLVPVRLFRCDDSQSMRCRRPIAGSLYRCCVLSIGFHGQSLVWVDGW